MLFQVRSHQHLSRDVQELGGHTALASDGRRIEKESLVWKCELWKEFMGVASDGRTDGRRIDKESRVGNCELGNEFMGDLRSY